MSYAISFGASLWQNLFQFLYENTFVWPSVLNHIFNVCKNPEWLLLPFQNLYALLYFLQLFLLKITFKH